MWALGMAEDVPEKKIKKIKSEKITFPAGILKNGKTNIAIVGSAANFIKKIFKLKINKIILKLNKKNSQTLSPSRRGLYGIGIGKCFLKK